MFRSETSRKAAALDVPLPLSNTPPRNMSIDPRYGPITVPRELNAWDRVSRRCDLSGTPSAAARGFAATCSTVIPLAMTNSASKTSS